MAELPDWQPLDGGVPVPNGDDRGRIVAVVATEKSVEGGWAPGAVLDLARAWSRAGEKVILVDGALHYPTLHEHVGLENVEGLSDAALFGLSVGRIAKPVDDGDFFLVTAGTAVADANAVAASPRWSRMLEGFTEAGVKLLLYVRDGDSGCATFLGAASDIVVLSDPGEAPPAAVRELQGLVRAVAGRGGPGMPTAVPGAVGPSGGAAGVRPPAEWMAEGPGGRTRLMILVACVVVLLLFVAVAFGLIPIPGLSPGAG